MLEWIFLISISVISCSAMIQYRQILLAFIRGQIMYYFQAPLRTEYGHYVLDYVFNYKTYSLPLFVQDCLPPDVLRITDDGGKDITQTVLRYAGPDYSFNGQKLNPIFFGTPSIQIEYLDGQMTIGPHDIIKFS